ncbi:K+/H+ antiporter subunit F [Piscinibacter sakaiensis]|uniref:K+/H+ antiporter subunit F n=1 Tax=Piscinibacter sakaiensis TaxID=1547922 RepID=UPI003AB00C11
MIIEWALNFALLAIALSMLLGGWRLLRGPDSCDRVLAIDTLYINVVALLVLLGIQQRSNLMFEVALVIAMLGFVSTVALARFLSRGDVIG